MFVLLTFTTSLVSGTFREVAWKNGIETIAARIVALVAEQTGYPAEMLAMDLDMEADLGISGLSQLP